MEPSVLPLPWKSTSKVPAVEFACNATSAAPSSKLVALSLMVRSPDHPFQVKPSLTTASMATVAPNLYSPAPDTELMPLSLVRVTLYLFLV